MIAQDSNTLPSYALATTEAVLYTWAASTSDPRALLKAALSSNRIASTYAAVSSFSFDLNVTDGNSHKVSLYCLDWDSTQRTQTISILDATANTLLNKQLLLGFHNGVYLSWNISGHVTIQVDNNPTGVNPVVSGFFLK